MLHDLLTFTIGVRAFLALWTLASPLPSPGPRCVSVAAGIPGHSSVAVCRTRNDAFKKSQDTAHFRVAIQCGHKVHFGCAGICKTDVYTGQRRSERVIQHHYDPDSISVPVRSHSCSLPKISWPETGARLRPLQRQHQLQLSRTFIENIQRTPPYNV